MRVGLRGRVVDFVKKKCVDKRERDRYRERERAARKGEEEGVRSKTKRVKMAPQKKWLLLKWLILGESQFCQFTDKCQKERKRTRVKSKCKT